MGDKIKFERGYYILVFCSGERENGDLHIGKVSNISAIKDPYSESDVALKGQLISEAIFLGFNSSKKRTRYFQNFALDTRVQVFCSYFVRIENKGI